MAMLDRKRRTTAVAAVAALAVFYVSWVCVLLHSPYATMNLVYLVQLLPSYGCVVTMVLLRSLLHHDGGYT